MMINAKSSLSTLWISGAFLLAIFDPAVGQTTDAVCNGTAWDWSYNSKGHNPCLVAAYLTAPCNNGQANIGKLKPNTHYDPPDDNSPNNCFCSSVVYSLIVTCGACQMDRPPAKAKPPLKWSTWIAACDTSTIAISTYPHVINPVTAVPGWAYFDVVTNDTFDILNASLSSNLLESTVGNIPTTTPSTLSSTSTPSNKPADTGLIIGVTVGGVVGLLIIGSLVWFTIRFVRNRRRQSSEASTTQPVIADVNSGLTPITQQGDTMFLPSSGYSGSTQGPSDQLRYSDGSPWSPPPTSSTPAVRTTSSMSVRTPGSISSSVGSTAPLLSNTAVRRGQSGSSQQYLTGVREM